VQTMAATASAAPHRDAKDSRTRAVADPLAERAIPAARAALATGRADRRPLLRPRAVRVEARVARAAPHDGHLAEMGEWEQE
ncbi:MAG: hypothetical protein LC791_01845, partial [Acidobacteria bacterium]|nr:hypothetical protein [Acidobacteriota bacterium]